MRKVILKDYKRYQNLVYEFWSKRGRMPTFEELKSLFDVRSKDTVFRIVNDLVSLGHILKDKTGKLLPVADKLANFNFSSAEKQTPKKEIELGLLGTVEAGFPTHIEAQDLESVKFEEWLIGDSNATFMLKVSGNSMIDIGICPGDYVIVERGKNPKIGDVVLAEVDGEWTLKFYKKDKQGIYLEPANKKFKIIRPKNNLSVKAVVVALVRKY